MEEFGLV